MTSNATSVRLGSGDTDFLGAYSTNHLGEGFENVDLYLLSQLDHTSGGPREVFVAGGRIQSKLDSIDYRIELTKQFGNAFSNPGAAYQGDLEVGWTIDSPSKARLGIELFEAGDNYSQLYPLAHKYLGIADVFGRKNIRGAVLHASVQPFEGLSALIDIHQLFRTSTEAPAFKLDGSTALGTTASISKTLGTEVDIIAVYSLSNGISLTLGGAALFPGEYLVSEKGDSVPTFFYSQLTAQL